MNFTATDMARIVEAFFGQPMHEHFMALRLAGFTPSQIDTHYDTALAIARSRSLNLVAAE